MNAKERTTKENIMIIAHSLFAKKGYDAVSVRDISKEAGVNLSSINYHFTNKLGLYSQIINWSIQKMMDELQEISTGDNVNTLKDYVGAVFDHFTSNASDFISCFKFFVSMNDIYSELNVECLKSEGPPGSEIMLKYIEKECPNASNEDCQWAMRSIFSIIYHKSLIVCNRCVIEEQGKFGHTPVSFKNDVIRASGAIVSSIK
ncbi:MAG: TetR/AcrR family transcriptional regulator [Bacteriovoracaceae bacterium]|jgi:hypothetical protein|nr:TetR/AcrR family transcriptional regulator [Bacteriovoracaceae bacterium]